MSGHFDSPANGAAKARLFACPCFHVDSTTFIILLMESVDGRIWLMAYETVEQISLVFFAVQVKL